MDFLTKDLVKSFEFSTINQYREGQKQMVVNGRTYVKLGQYQVVTMVGNLYKCYDPNVESFKYMLMVGVAKQHPRDLKITKREGLEVANEKAHICPSIIMEVPSSFDKEHFDQVCWNYYEMVLMSRLEFVKTQKEINSEQIELPCCDGNLFRV